VEKHSDLGRLTDSYLLSPLALINESEIKKSKRMKRKKQIPKEDEFIERKIITALIVSTAYFDRVRKFWSSKLLDSSEAKLIAGWCLEYWDKYNKAPGEEIESIFMRKTRKLPKQMVDAISKLLAGLSDDYDKEDKFNVDYRYDQTFKYFESQQARLLIDNLNEALEQNDMDEFYKLRSSFNPIRIESDEKTTFKGMEIYNMEIKSKKWLIEDLLPKGLTIFGGQSKIGKSYLALNFGIHLAEGKLMFADQPTFGYKGSKGPVLFLALEDPMERLKSRINAIEPNPNKKLLNRNFTIVREWDKLIRRGLADLEEWLKKSKQPKLIVIDVIAKVWDMKSSTGGGRWYTQEYQIFGPLADLAHKYETSIIVITHTKKSREDDVFNEILGGAGTQGPADNLMVLSRHPGDKNKRILAIRGKDMKDQHLLFEVFEEGAKWECLGEVDEAQKTNERQSIVDYIRMTGKMSLKDIQQAARDGKIDVSSRSVHITLRKMIKDGTLIQPRPYGKYSVPRKTNEMIRLKHPKKKSVG